MENPPEPVILLAAHLGYDVGRARWDRVKNSTRQSDEEEGILLSNLGEPQVLFVADGDFKQGYWTSLAFTRDSKKLIGTLERTPGSVTRFLLGQRVGEVRSFDLTAVNKRKRGNDNSKSTLLMTARNIHHNILATPSGVSREPLLLARWDARFQKIEVVALRGPKESVRRRFPIPRSDQITPHTDSSICVTLTPRAKMLVLGTSCTEWKDRGRAATQWGDVKGWDLRTGKPRFEDSREGSRVLAVACSADGKLIAAAGGHFEERPFRQTRYEGRVVCWKGGFEKKHFDVSLPNHQVHCLAFSPDNNTLVIGGLDGTVKWIDVKDGTVTKSLEVASRSGKSRGRIECLAFSPDGKLLAVGTGSWNRGNKWGMTFLIDVRQGTITKVPSSQENHVITCVAFAPDGKYLATGGMEGILKLWQITPGK